MDKKDTILYLHKAIEAVCPIFGVSGSVDNRESMTIHFQDTATQEQKEEAIKVLISWDASSAPDVDKFLTTLRLSPDMPIELLPYLALWSPDNIADDFSRKSFWAKVKGSNPYFLSVDKIKQIESLAISCNLPLE